MKRISLGLCLVGGSLHATTYNLYFNNVEQGDNSTASPGVKVVQVDDGEKSAKSPEVGENSGKAKSESPATIAPATTMSSEASTSVAAVAKDSDENTRRISLGVVGFAPGPSGVVMIGYRPRPYLGFRLFAGNNHEWAGADVELAPLLDTSIDSATRMSLRPLVGWVSFWDPDMSSGGIHAGVRTEVEVDKNWEVFAAFRLGIDMASLEGGVTWRF